MERHYSDDTFLARWAAGELSPQELEAFKKSKDYPVFKKINDASLLLETPTYDNQEHFEKLRQLQNQQSFTPKVKKLVPNWAYAAAASLLIMFSLFYVINMESHYQTGFGEQLAVVLPDNSHVELNAKSELNYKSRNWNNQRTLTLNGEAFFDVEKGSTFKVITQSGEVVVLGTEFNVISRENYLEVACFEGKVKVISNNKEIILPEGQALRLLKNNLEEWNLSKSTPGWLAGESSFKNAPLSQVVLSLQNQYNISFDTSSINTNERFTGSFTHSDLNLALKTVFTPMDVKYSANEDNTLKLSNSSDKN